MEGFRQPHSGSNRRIRAKAARELAEIFDSKLFKALCEPVRIDIVKFLTAEGRCDVQTVAAQFPQHASVVSRHLGILHQAGVVQRQKIGRHVFFEVDGQEMVDRMERILERFRNILPLCCARVES